MRLDSRDERNYYLREAAQQNWSSRLLERNIKSGYYRRILSTRVKASENLADALPGGDLPKPADFIKDPYVLEFLDVPEDPVTTRGDVGFAPDFVRD